MGVPVLAEQHRVAHVARARERCANDRPSRQRVDSKLTRSRPHGTDDGDGWRAVASKGSFLGRNCWFLQGADTSAIHSPHSRPGKAHWGNPGGKGKSGGVVRRVRTQPVPIFLPPCGEWERDGETKWTGKDRARRAELLLVSATHISSLVRHTMRKEWNGKAH